MPSVRTVNRRGFSGGSLNVNWAAIAGALIMFLGAGLLALGAYHGFEHGSCSTTGYSPHYGPVQRCTKGIGWWIGLATIGGLMTFGGAFLATSVGGALVIPILFIAIGAPFVALGLGAGHEHLLYGGSASSGKTFSLIFGSCFVVAGVVWGVFAAGSVVDDPDFEPGAVPGALLAGAVGIGAAFAIAAVVNSAIGKTTTPVSGVSVANSSGVTILSAQQVRANRIAICKHLVAAQTHLSATVTGSLSSQCSADPAAAEARLRVEARKADIAFAVTQCKQGVSAAGNSLHASAQAIIKNACGTQAKSSHPGTNVQSTAAAACQAIVKAQVPPAYQQQALASCPKS